jgi:hypothetical protein
MCHEQDARFQCIGKKWVGMVCEYLLIKQIYSAEVQQFLEELLSVLYQYMVLVARGTAQLNLVAHGRPKAAKYPISLLTRPSNPSQWLPLSGG